MTAAKPGRRPRRWRRCVGKRAHKTQAAAAVHVQHLVDSGAAENAYEPYECPHCGKWHVGHRSNRDRSDR